MADNELGEGAPSVLLRRLIGVDGEIDLELEFCPRPEYGQVRISLQPLGDGLLVLGSNEPIALYSPGVDWEIANDGSNDTAVAEISTRSRLCSRAFLVASCGVIMPSCSPSGASENI